jgi:hypothetical protein
MLTLLPLTGTIIFGLNCLAVSWIAGHNESGMVKIIVCITSMIVPVYLFLS